MEATSAPLYPLAPTMTTRTLMTELLLPQNRGARPRATAHPMQPYRPCDKLTIDLVIRPAADAELAARKIVSSPAIVPTAPCGSALSSSEASAGACPGPVRITTSVPACLAEIMKFRSAAASEIDS